MKNFIILIWVCILAGCVVTQSVTNENSVNSGDSPSSFSGSGSTQKSNQQEESAKPEINAYAFCVPTRDGERWGLVDDSGGLIMVPKYKKINAFKHTEDGSFLAVVKGENDLYGYIDENGEERVVTQLDNAKAFSEMFVARFEKDGKWGFIDSSGKVIIPPQYDSVWPMTNGYAAVEKDGKDMYIDKTGKPLNSKKYAGLWPFNSNGRARYREEKGGLFGLMDSTGKIITKPKFEFIGSYNNENRAPAEIEKKGKSAWGIIDENGKWVVKPKYPSMDLYFHGNLIIARDDDYNEFVIDQDGKVVLSTPSKEVVLCAQCERISTGYRTRNFYDWNGNKIAALSSKYEWFDYFDDNCSGLAFNGSIWGRVSADGKFIAFPHEIMEPYTEKYNNSIINTFNNPFIPALDNNRRLVYINQDNQIAFRSDVKKKPDSDVFILKTPEGKTLWQAKFVKNSLTKEHPFFFNPKNKDIGFQDSWLNDIAPVVTQLKSDKPRYFNVSLQQPYKVDLSDYSYASFGTTAMLAYHYFSETDLGQYDFLWEEYPLSGKFDGMKAQLIKRFGPVLHLDEELTDQLSELGLHPGDRRYSNDSVAVWNMENNLLVLCDYSLVGDGDSTRSLTLSLLTSKSKLEQSIPLAIDTIEKIKISDSSDDEVKKLVKALPDNAENPRIVRKLVAKIHGLVHDGRGISEYDYLWTLYGLLKFSYPSLEGGLNKKDCIKVAETAMHYLDNNGVGQWVYTEPGQFKMEVYRLAGNAVAWLLRESEPQKALSYIEAALTYARDEDTYLQDTYVRVLLNLNNKEKGYAIVKAVLEEDPDFVDFQDFLSNEDYLNWLK